MIYTGVIEDIQWSNGTWLLFDIGFSNKKRSCGLLLHDGKPKSYHFGEAVAEVIKQMQNHENLNLVIEAPLSVVFDRNGNPKGRSIEKKGNRTRYWYYGPGCTVLVATTYFLKKLVDSKPAGNIRLFEGFVSYKDKGEASDHVKDVILLRKSIMSRNPLQYCKQPHELKLVDDDVLESAFKVAGMDFGIPPVIQGAKGK